MIRGQTIEIVLADDHGVVRQGLRALLEAEPGFTVVGEARDGLSAVALIAEKKPHVAVVDLAMPGLGGLDVARRAEDVAPRTRVVILSMYTDTAYVHQALCSGAAAYVIKDSSAIELVRAIHAAVEGRRYLSPPLNFHVVRDYARKKAATGRRDSYSLLTTREREVLHLVAEGLTAAQIGERLRIRPRTVESHRANVMKKLGFHSQREIVRYVLARGLLPLGHAPRGEG